MVFKSGNKPWNEKQIDEGRLIQEYAVDQGAISKLSAEWGVDIGCLYRRLSRLGITRRTNSSAHKGLQAGVRNPNWRGGRRLDGAGYVAIRVLTNTEVREHRIVAAEMLGRSLLATEVVHHKNHNRSDNRPVNLEVLPSQSVHMKEHMTTEEATRRGRMTKRSRAALAAVGSPLRANEGS